jgi:hypothetical protein
MKREKRVHISSGISLASSVTLRSHHIFSQQSVYRCKSEAIEEVWLTGFVAGRTRLMETLYWVTLWVISLRLLELLLWPSLESKVYTILIYLLLDKTLECLRPENQISISHIWAHNFHVSTNILWNKWDFYKMQCKILLSWYLLFKNGVFWDVTPCGSWKNRHLGGT